MGEDTDRRRRQRRDDPTTRREFIKQAAIATVAAATGPSLAARAFADTGPLFGAAKQGNLMPGRVVLLRDTAMAGHESTIDRDQVAVCVQHGVRLLTQIDETAAAFESLFPGLHSGSTVAIKVNCLAWNDTRWEVVRGVVEGLSTMLGGTFDVSQVTIYDVQTTLSNHGYVAGQFTFNGNTPTIISANNCSPDYWLSW